VAFDEELFGVERLDREGPLLDTVNGADGLGGIGHGDISGRVGEDGREGEAKSGFSIVDRD
jgi:hypothetical protein